MQPIVPFGGVTGWEFLKRTRTRQQQSFENSPIIQRAAATFKARFDKITTAEDLVSDREALKVVLGAFGLQDDLNNRAFIRKVITDGGSSRDALANRLADKRYLALATELSHLGPAGSGETPASLADSLLQRFKATEFEIAVGKSDENMRLAMAFGKKLSGIATGVRSDAASWFQILGDPPTRKVLETALGLPKEFAGLDVDEQAKRLRSAAQKTFGAANVTDLANPDLTERIVKRFLLMAQINENQAGMSGAAIALSLLSARR